MMSKIKELGKNKNLWMLLMVAVFTYTFTAVFFAGYFIKAPLMLQFSNSLIHGAGTLAYKIVSTFVMCHELPQRSFFLFDIQHPICARDVGTYGGAALGGLMALLLRDRLPKILKTKKAAFALMLPMMIDGVTQTLLFARESNNTLRLATGLLFSIGLFYYVTAKVLDKAKELELDVKDAVKIGLVVFAALFIVILPLSLYVGLNTISKDQAIETALSQNTMEYALVKAYYIPENAINNIKRDPYLKSYDDQVLKDVYKMNARNHPYGIWAIALLNQEPDTEGNTVYLTGSEGTVVYVDAVTGELLKEA